MSQQLGDVDEALVLFDLSTLRDIHHMHTVATALHTAAVQDGNVKLVDDTAQLVPFTCITDVPSPALTSTLTSHAMGSARDDGVGEDAHVATSSHGSVAAEHGDDHTMQVVQVAHACSGSIDGDFSIESTTSATSSSHDDDATPTTPTTHDTYDDDAWATRAIWQLPPVVIAFACSRAASKELALMLTKVAGQE